MKKAMVFLTGMLLLLSIRGFSQNQTHADYFAGQWVGLAQGTPAGDMQIKVTLERKEGSLGGVVKISDQDEVKISKVDEKDSLITVFFTSSHGYDVNITMSKKDDNHVDESINTSMMGSISFAGERKVDEIVNSK